MTNINHIEEVHKKSIIHNTSSINNKSPSKKFLFIDNSIEGLTRIVKTFYNNNHHHLITSIEENHNDENIQSNIYLAKVVKIDLSTNSIFLNYEGSKLCFLNMKELIKQNFTWEDIQNIKINDEFIVQTIRERKNYKHPKVTTNIMMYGLYANIMVDNHFDVIYHNNSLENTNLYNSLIQNKNLHNIKIFIKQPPQTINQKLLIDDIKYMIRTWKHIKTIAKNKKDSSLLYFEPHIQRMIRSILDSEIETIIVDNDDLYQKIKVMPFLFTKHQAKNIILMENNILESHGLLEEINKIEKLTVQKDGIRINFHKTEALITVDVDYSAKNKNLKNLWSINQEAAKMIMDEIIKKNVGGSVVIDFINMYMAQEHHTKFNHWIKDYFQEHSINCAVYGVKQLGLVILCLPYNKYDIFHRIYEKCNNCNSGSVLKMSHQIQNIIYLLENFFENTTAISHPLIYTDNNKIYIKGDIYNYLVKNYSSIIVKMLSLQMIPLVF